MLDARNTEITREGGERASHRAPPHNGAKIRPPALETTEIRGDAGPQARTGAPARATAPAPADETTGATAPEQGANRQPPARATQGTPPAEDPGAAGRDGAPCGTPERARRLPPRHEDPVLIEDGGEAVQLIGASNGHTGRDRFADPLIAEITEIWRLRQRVVEAQRKLTLQAHAVCRAFTRGDKAEAQKLFAAIQKGGDHPLAAQAGVALHPYFAAMEPFVAQRNAYERHLTKLGRDLPIAHMADRVRGLSTLTLAKIVGELGDLSAYRKGIAGIWKRAGLAVIGGERQRLKTGDEAHLHGYSPRRRSVFFTMQGPLMQAQGADGPYRQVYDARKGHELARGLTKAHAHNRAQRHMMKRLLKDLWREWRAQ